MSAFIPATILVINSSCRKEKSHSRQLTDQVVQQYLTKNPNIKIITRDVGLLPISPPNEEWITANLTEPENLTEDQKQILENSDILISELKQAEIVVFGCPMYNFSISASLKAYFDLCCRSGHTFTYTEKGPQGLLVGKKAVICTTSAGVPSGSEVDFVSSYMKQVCNFIGITDCTIIHANGLMTGNESEIIKNAKDQIFLLN